MASRWRHFTLVFGFLVLVAALVGRIGALNINERAFLKRQRKTVMGALPWGAAFMAAVLIYWASISELEEVTRGIGKVIPSKSVQLIQSLEAQGKDSSEVRHHFDIAWQKADVTLTASQF